MIFYQTEDNNNDNLETLGDNLYIVDRDSKIVGENPRLELINNKIN